MLGLNEMEHESKTTAFHLSFSEVNFWKISWFTTEQDNQVLATGLGGCSLYAEMGL